MTEVDLTELTIDRSGTGASRIRTRRHVITRYVFPLVLILGFLSLVMWTSRDIVFPPHPVTVTPVVSATGETHQAGIPLFKAAGWIEPRPTAVRVAALAPGVVEQLLVVEDQPVKSGEPVAELVKDDARLSVDRAAAELALRQAELAEARAEYKAAETRLKQPVHLEAALRQADAALAKTQTELKTLPFELQRAEADRVAARKDFDGKEASKGVVAGIQIDIARSKLDSARALVAELSDRDTSLRKEQTALAERRRAVQTQLELLADEIEAKEQAEARVNAATARVEHARVVLAEAKLKLDRMTIVAPIDGRVFRLIADPGTRIGSGMTQMSGHDGSTIVTMYRPHMLQVRVDVRFEDVPEVSLHQQVEIDNAAIPAPLKGEVLFISSEADIQKNTLQVKVAIVDPPPVFKPEMLVDVTFLSPEPKGSSSAEQPRTAVRLFVPRQLIQEDSGEAYIWIADQSEGTARRQAIQTAGPNVNGLVQVTSGLTISTRLIVSGFAGLTDGCRIRITGGDSTPATNNFGP